MKKEKQCFLMWSIDLGNTPYTLDITDMLEYGSRSEYNLGCIRSAIRGLKRPDGKCHGVKYYPGKDPLPWPHMRCHSGIGLTLSN